jgi:hypothetical protein
VLELELTLLVKRTKRRKEEKRKELTQTSSATNSTNDPKMDKRPQGTSVPRPKPSAIGQNRSGHQNRDEDEDLHLLDEILQGPADDDAMPVYKKIAYGFGEVGTPLTFFLLVSFDPPF